jgi:hypothetical protein
MGSACRAIRTAQVVHSRETGTQGCNVSSVARTGALQLRVAAGDERHS